MQFNIKKNAVAGAGGVVPKPAVGTAPILRQMAGVASTPTADVTLPEEEEVWEAPKEVTNFSIFIYGAEGIGKSSFAAMFPNTFHLFYEPSGKDLGGAKLAGYRREPANWQEFLSYVTLIENQKAEGKLRFENVVIDVVDVCFYHCLLDYLQSKNLTEMPNDYGKSWQAVEQGFRQAVYRLARCCGVIFLSHRTEKKTKHMDEKEYETITPTIMNKGNSVLTKFCDIKGYYRMDEYGDRELVIRPTTWCESKNRFESRFKHVNGVPVESIPMGKSKEEAWESFLLAFNNSLPVTEKIPFNQAIKRQQGVK